MKRAANEVSDLACVRSGGIRPPSRSLRSRLVRCTKWGGAAVTVVLVAAWVASWWWQWMGPFPVRATCGMQIGGYWVRTGWGSTEFAIRQHSDRRFHLKLWPPMWYHDRVRNELWVPGWMPVIPALACTALAWRLDTLARRRARLNLCPKCHYDRAGLAAVAKCPECGEPPALSSS
jgi:hypothetical protein